MLFHRDQQLLTYLSTWLVQTMTGCCELSLLSLTCKTLWIHIHSLSLVFIRNSRMQERSCSDCIISRCLDWASRRFSQWTRSYQDNPCTTVFEYPKWNSPLVGREKTAYFILSPWLSRVIFIINTLLVLSRLCWLRLMAVGPHPNSKIVAQVTEGEQVAWTAEQRVRRQWTGADRQRRLPREQTLGVSGQCNGLSKPAMSRTNFLPRTRWWRGLSACPFLLSWLHVN